MRKLIPTVSSPLLNYLGLGRELQGMGLITQVKKGEKVPSALPGGSLVSGAKLRQ